MAIVLLNLRIIESQLASSSEGMGGLAYVGVAVVAIFVLAPLLLGALIGVLAPLVVLDVIGIWWALGAPSSEVPGEQAAWQLMAVPFGVAGAIGAWLQVVRLRRRQPSDRPEAMPDRT
jgi:hypothetical protein